MQLAGYTEWPQARCQHRSRSSKRFIPTQCQVHTIAFIPGVREVWVIEKVERFGTKLQVRTLLKPKGTT
jgi:hypothetical protein